MTMLIHEHEEVPVTDRVRDAAACIPGGLRTLDAIHVASAEMLRPDLAAMVTYDKRMAQSARQAGLPVAMPGME